MYITLTAGLACMSACFSTPTRWSSTPYEYSTAHEIIPSIESLSEVYKAVVETLDFTDCFLYNQSECQDLLHCASVSSEAGLFFSQERLNSSG